MRKAIDLDNQLATRVIKISYIIANRLLPTKTMLPMRAGRAQRGPKFLLALRSTLTQFDSMIDCICIITVMRFWFRHLSYEEIGSVP